MTSGNIVRAGVTTDGAPGHGVYIYIYIAYGVYCICHVTHCYMRAGFFKSGLHDLKTDPPCVITSFGCKTEPFLL
jgi:hypothetical protein